MKFDANKIGQPPRKNASLAQLAKEINALLRHERSVRLAIGDRLLLAADKFKSTDKFLRWCSINFRKQDGTAYAASTFTNYLSLARDPSRIQTSREAENATNSLGTTIRRMQRHKCVERVKHLAAQHPQASYDELASRLEVPRETVRRYINNIDAPRLVPIDQEVNLLMTAWEAASDQARAQFLSLIGAVVRRRA